MHLILMRVCRVLVFGMAVVGASLLNDGTAKAGPVGINGQAGGCFGVACIPSGTGQSQTASLLGLTYNGSRFDPTMTNGSAPMCRKAWTSSTRASTSPTRRWERASTSCSAPRRKSVGHRKPSMTSKTLSGTFTNTTPQKRGGE